MNRFARFAASALALSLVPAMLMGCGKKEASTGSDLDYIKQKGTLVVGITDFAPMDYQDADGSWIGFDADLAKAFAESLGVEVQFQTIEWDNKVMELDGKTIDVVWNGMTLTDEVTSSMACSNAYCNNAQVVILPADKAADYDTVDSLSGLRFAVESGSAGMAQAEEKGLNLRKDLFLEVAFVTGERLSEKMRSQMEKKYDLIMRQGYGTADVGCIGYECFHKTGLHIANRCYVEICHPDTGIPLKDGEVGEIVVTAFNKTYPLIRLATGDLSYIDRSPCACGRTSPRLGNIVGRVDTTARIMGMFVYPHQVEQVMARFEDIKRWQIEVINPGGIDEMTLFIETSGFKREEELLHQFREKIKLRPELKILAPGSLPPQIRPIEDKRHWD